eukprot:TRINITY_DN7302_c0_g1_i1.p1 TRINITY_DN7302_c0_g1~~TRINITY_DN7302_c0_g1_i1.p1  ORF type:complete len:596 (-),score=117.45 TRINITY_DN7302_c0_g1_i1:82-1869(-)
MHMPKTIVEVVGRINDKLVANDPTLTELSWSLSILESFLDNRMARSKLERRTYIRYCNEENIAPEILPCNKNFAKLLSQALANNKTLTSLTINGYEGNDIHKKNFTHNFAWEEAGYLAEALRTNKSLTKIDLSTNRIDDRGARALAYALGTNRTVKKLILCRNFISHKGIAELAEVLIKNFAIEELAIGNQLKATHGRGVVPASGSDYQRDLFLLIEHSLKRKRELQSRTPLYMEPHEAEDQLKNALPGTYLFYLRKHIANVIFIACVVDKKKIKEELARGSQRVPPFLKAFVQRDYGSKKKESTTAIMHKALYRIKYGYSFYRTPSISDFPTLLGQCAWMICSDDPLYQTTQLVDVFSEDIREKVEATKLLQPMWGVKSVPEQAHNDYAASASTTWFSFEHLIKFNSLWLSKPLTTSSSSLSSPSSSSSMTSLFSKLSISSHPIPAHDCTAPSETTSARFHSNNCHQSSVAETIFSSHNGHSHGHFLSHSTDEIETKKEQKLHEIFLTGSESSIKIVRTTTTTSTSELVDSIDTTDQMTSSTSSGELLTTSDWNSSSPFSSSTSMTNLLTSSPTLSPSSSFSSIDRAHDCSQPP